MAPTGFPANAELRNKVSLPALRTYARILTVPVYFLGCFENCLSVPSGKKFEKLGYFMDLQNKKWQ